MDLNGERKLRKTQVNNIIIRHVEKRVKAKRLGAHNIIIMNNYEIKSLIMNTE